MMAYPDRQDVTKDNAIGDTIKYMPRASAINLSGTHHPDHTIQFYESEDFLADSLCEFISLNLEQGGTCIFVATADHLSRIKERMGDQLDIAQANGWFIALDAAATLAAITTGTMPDRHKFAAIIEPVIAQVSATGRPVNAFGEMVALLCSAKNYKGAIRLEQLWNRLLEQYSFSLYCAYPMQLFNSEQHAALLDELATAHSIVVPTESYTGLCDSQEQLRSVALLQQKAESLAAGIKKRNEAEKALQLSEVRYRRLFEAAQDGILIIDAETLQILDANPAVEEILESSSEELVGMTVSEVHPFRECQVTLAKITDLPDIKVLRHETYMVTKLGLRHDLEIVGNMYQEDIRAIIQLNIRDITERKKAEQLEATTLDLIAERRELIALNAAKDDFISLASHQLRTPATAVKQYVGLLLQGYVGELSEPQLHHLQKAFDSNERQIKTVNDLLLVARVDSGKIELAKEQCDIAQLIRDAAQEQEVVIAKRGQSIKLSLPKSLKATVDLQYMRMVLDNLINNASKYSFEGTPIKITAAKKEGQLVIAVADKGIGISRKDQHRLYQKFSRIYNSRTTFVEGTGLGLYWSKKIIELHDGLLTLSSRPNHGSTFTITIPLTEKKNLKQ